MEPLASSYQPLAHKTIRQRHGQHTPHTYPHQPDIAIKPNSGQQEAHDNVSYSIEAHERKGKLLRVEFRGDWEVDALEGGCWSKKSVETKYGWEGREK